MMVIKVNRRALFRRMTQQGLDVQTLAKRAGTSDSAIYQMLRGLSNPRLSTLSKLAQALDMKVEKLVIYKEE